jgi:hypothetical protein
MSSGEGWKTPNMLGLLGSANLQGLKFDLSNGPNRVGVSYPSSEDEKNPVSKTLCSSEYMTMDRVQKPSNPKTQTTT